MRRSNTTGELKAARSPRSRGSTDVTDSSGHASAREGSERSRSRLRRVASRGFREFWQVDGACDARSFVPRESGVDVFLGMEFFATRRHAVTAGIRERIAGLRRRARTAPGRLET